MDIDTKRLSELEWEKAKEDYLFQRRDWGEYMSENRPFGEMSILQDNHMFRSFIYGFDLGRLGTKASHDEVRKMLQQMKEPSLEDVFQATRNFRFSRGPARPSITYSSKFLAIWRPKKFVMRDSLSTLAARHLLRSRKAEVDGNTPEKYSNYQRLICMIISQAPLPFAKSEVDDSSSTLRVADIAMVNLGRKKRDNKL